VLFVPTRDFVRPAKESPNPTHGHHEFGNAETYFLVGDALGKGMVKLLAPQLKEKPVPDKGKDKSEVPPKKAFKVDGHAAFVIMPPRLDEKKPVPWVWYAPTFPSLPEAREHWMFEKFLAAGIAIAGVDVGESYGSPKGREVYSALYKELVINRNFAAKPVLLARSRGGLMLYNWAAENPDKVAGIAGIYPVCDLRSYPGLDKACGAYGLTRAELEEQLDKHNPVARLAPLAKAGVPIFHIHGDTDAVVPLKENSAEVAKQYEKLGGKMELKVAKEQGHNLWEGFFQCQELVDFVLTRAAPAKQPK
jgi:pimeloyl-ACP methyl ester carboxylesterase